MTVNRTRSDTFEGRELMSLLRQHVPHDFDPGDFLIAGSARLWADGLTLELSDLDIVARPGSRTWQRAVEIAFEHALAFQSAPFRVSAYSGDKIAQLYGGDIEVCETWVMPGGDTDALLAKADVIDGLRYLPVEEVIAYKQLLDRDKDRSDLVAIERATQDRPVRHGFTARRPLTPPG